MYKEGKKEEKDTLYARCREAEQVQSRLVLSIRGGMTCSNDIPNMEMTCHKA